MMSLSHFLHQLMSVITSTLAHASVACIILHDKTTTMGWTKRKSSCCPAVYGDLLFNRAFTLQDYQFMESIVYQPGYRNILADNTYHCWDLFDNALLCHFNSHYQELHYWKLIWLVPTTMRRIITVLQGGTNKIGTFWAETAPEPYHGRSASSYVPSSHLLWTLLGFITPFPFSKYLPTKSRWSHWKWAPRLYTSTRYRDV